MEMSMQNVSRKRFLSDYSASCLEICLPSVKQIQRDHEISNVIFRQTRNNHGKF